MSIIGVTINYGPFGFVEYFHDEFVANYSDCNARYWYKQQACVCLWKLDQLALSLDELNIISYDNYYDLYTIFVVVNKQWYWWNNWIIFHKIETNGDIEMENEKLIQRKWQIRW